MIAAKRIDKASLVVAALLGLAAALVWYDASKMTIGSRYGLGPEVMPKVISLGLLALAIGHIINAFRGGLPVPEAVDSAAIGWLGAGLLALIFSVGSGLGFIPAMALVFGATARGFAEPRVSPLATRLMFVAFAGFIIALAGSYWTVILGPVGTWLEALYGSVAPIIGFISALIFTAALIIRPGRAGLRDLAIGIVLGAVIYVMFTRLLTLSLPQGPLERLL
jgi:putative tricarboxylic transport membrane protein